MHTLVLENPHYEKTEVMRNGFIQNVGIAGALVYLMGVMGGGEGGWGEENTVICMIESL